LALVCDFSPIAGDLFIVLDNDLAEAITGTLDGLGEGAYVVSNGRAFQFSYQGGTGNDLVAVLTNTAPALDPIGNQTVDEQTALTPTAAAADPETPAQSLTYSLSGAPDGASINPTTGGVSWTPSEAQGPGSFTFTVRVTDNGSPNLFDEESITIAVYEVNRNPQITLANSEFAVDEETAMNFTVPAVDQDLPANTLTFSISGAPAGASFNPATGEFSWTPTEAQGRGEYSFNVFVRDDGSPNLDDGINIVVTVSEVNHAPVLAPVDDQTATLGELIRFTA